MATPAERHLEAPPTAASDPWSERWAALAAGLGMFLAALDIALNVALPAITRDFGSDLQTVQWIIVVFIATRAALVLGAGSFADGFGLRRVYLFGAATYLASMFCIVLSPTLAMVVGFRVLQALGTGCLYAASPAISAWAFPNARRGLGMGITAASQAVGMVAGTLGAGLLVQWFDWEAVFLGRVPFALLAVALGIRCPGLSPASALRPSFDALGAAALGATLFCLVIGLRLGRSLGWTDPMVLALLPSAPVFLGAFWWCEGRAAWPVLPRQLLRNRSFVVASLSLFLAHLGVFVIWFIFPFYVEDHLGRGPLALGLMLAAMSVLNMGLSGLGGWLCDRAGTKVVGVSGLVALGGGLLYMGFLDRQSGLAEVGFRIALTGAGLGLIQAAAYTLMMASVPPSRFATAAAALSLAQAFGTVISVAAIGGIFAASNDHYMSGLAGADLPLREMEGRAFVLAFRNVFWLGAAFAALGAGVFMLSRRSKPS